MSCEACKGHDKPKELDEATVIKQVAKVDSKHRFLCIAVAILTAGFVLMAGFMGYTAVNAQRIANEAATEAIKAAQEEMNKALLEALETVAEMEVVSETTTTTTEVTQDTGEGGGNNVYLDGDNTTYNEGGEGE